MITGIFSVFQTGLGYLVSDDCNLRSVVIMLVNLGKLETKHLSKDNKTCFCNYTIIWVD